MKQYQVTFETHDTTWTEIFEAKGRTAAENKAESLIETLFFSDKFEKDYFYTLTEVDTGKRRVIKAMNVMAPYKPL